jgi:hypothetical protein
MAEFAASANGYSWLSSLSQRVSNAPKPTRKRLDAHGPWKMAFVMQSGRVRKRPSRALARLKSSRWRR